MKRFSAIFCLLLGIAASASAAVRVVVSGGVLRDAGGTTLAPGSLVAVVASTQDGVFASPTAGMTLQAGATFGGDDVVLAVFPVGATNTAVDGGFVGTVSLDYAAMGISNFGAGDQLKLYWFPAAGLSGAQILPNASYGSYRTDTLASRSNLTWLAPDDSSGGTMELNFLTQATGGDIANSFAIAGLNVSSSTNDVTVAATDAAAAEPSNPGAFTFTRNGSTAAALTANFTVSGTATSGTDYTSIGTTVTFTAGSATVTLPVNLLDDALVEGTETVVLTLASGSGYTVGSPSSATITVQDDETVLPTITVAATDPVAGEAATGEGTGTFTFTRNGAIGSALTVNFTVSGTATSGTDYTSVGSTVTFAAGSATATKLVSVIDDALEEDDETVVITLASGGSYVVGSPAAATVILADDDFPATETAYVTGVALGTVRNDYSGWVGMQITVGANPLTISQLGRMMTPGNSGSHTVKLVRASDGLDVAGGAVTIAMSGGTVGQFRYGALAAPLTLTASTVYWVLSQEIAGGDYWHDRAPITTTTVATDNAVVWGTGPGAWNPYPLANESFVPVDFKYTTNPLPPGETAYVTGGTLGTLRNDYNGWVGMQIMVGANPLTISQLGRMTAPGNTGTHTVKLVRASDGLDVAGSAVAIAMSGGTVGQFRYGGLSTPVTLSPGAVYWVLSQEFAGGDRWHDRGPITTTAVATDTAVVWGTGLGDWNPYPLANESFVPVDFKYTTSVPPTGTAYVTGGTLGAVRNDYSGWVGMQITVGGSPLTISQLGRMTAPGNTGTHTVKLVRASDGLDVAGSAVAIAMSGATVGQFRYGGLPTPVTLSPGAVYWVLSQEFAGGDNWHDRAPITTTGVATNNAVVWGTGPGDWNPYPLLNQSFVPVDFKY